MRLKSVISSIALAGTMALGAASSANAVVFIGSGSIPNGKPVSASADFTLGSGAISISLSDLQSGQISSGQTVSGIVFTISGISAVSLNTATGSLENVNDNGTETAVSGAIGHWGVGLTSGTTVRLATVGQFAKGGQPDYLIVGPTPNQNNGFDNFNPYINGTGVFTLNATGVTSLSSITGVSFLFGTEKATWSVAGDPRTPAGPAAPEPATWAMMLLGFAGVGFMAYRRKSRWPGLP